MIIIVEAKATEKEFKIHKSMNIACYSSLAGAVLLALLKLNDAIAVGLFFMFLLLYVIKFAYAVRIQKNNKKYDNPNAHFLIRYRY